MDIVCHLHAPSIGANRSAPQWSLLARSVISLRSSNLVAFGAKRTLGPDL